MKLTPRQLISFLPEAVDLKLPPHVSLRIKVKDKDEDKIDNYDGHKWLQLLRTLDQMHENSIRIRLKSCTLAPAMLRMLYEVCISPPSLCLHKKMRRKVFQSTRLTR